MKTSYSIGLLCLFLPVVHNIAAQIPPPPPDQTTNKGSDGKSSSEKTSDKKENKDRSMVLLLNDYKIVRGMVFHGDGYYRLRKGKEVNIYGERDVMFAAEEQDEGILGFVDPTQPTAEDQVRRFLESKARRPDRLEAMNGMNPEALNAFPTRIEPVLMNQCAECHCREGRAGRFKLTRVEPGYADAASSKKNLSVVLEFISRSQPTESPLLKYAASAHGGRKTATLDARHPALKNLEAWTTQLASSCGSPTTPEKRANPNPTSPSSSSPSR